MPSANDILESLSSIAESWQALAMLWHAYFAAFLAAIPMGWRPSNRLVGALLVPAIASVSILAWMHENPFNGTAFGMLSALLIALLPSLDTAPVETAPPAWRAAGMFFFAFGWVYPHFLAPGWSSVYLYAAPLGLIPCPTLSITVGLAIVFGGLRSRAWALALTAAGLFYGVFGSVYLGVSIDWMLVAGALGLLTYLIRHLRRRDAGAA